MKKLRVLILAALIAALIPFVPPSQGNAQSWQGGYYHLQPSVANNTSVELLPANQFRKTVTIQNNTGGNIMINLNGEELTGIVPTATNKGFVLVDKASYTTPANFVMTTAITCYQSSGGTVRTISVAEGN